MKYMLNRLLTALLGCRGAESWDRHSFWFLPFLLGWSNEWARGKWRCKDCGAFKAFDMKTGREYVIYE